MTQAGNIKVFVPVAVIMGGLALSFYGPKQKKSGHNLFDINK